MRCPHGIRRRPTLPGRFQPSTISVLRLNFCVRDGNRWIPQAIVTGNQTEFGFYCCRAFFSRRFGNRTASRLPSCSPLSGFPFLAFTIAWMPLSLSHPPHPQNRTGRSSASSDQDAASLLRNFALASLKSVLSDQALDRLVSSSSIRYRTSTDDLSTLSSSRGLTCLLQWQFFSPGGLHA